MKTSWVAFVQPRQRPLLRLFCFPYAGGGASLFRSWSQALAGRVEVCPVELPGRGTRRREDPLEDLAALVPDLAEGLGPWLDRPFALFGHSVGALVAFELARHLRRVRRPQPHALFLSAHRSPSLPYRGRLIKTLSEEELNQRLRRFGGTPPELLEQPELLRHSSKVLRADSTLSQTYVHREERPLDLPIHVFGGVSDPIVPLEQLEGWRCQTSARFTLRTVPGDHFFLHSTEPLILGILGHELRKIIAGLADAEADTARLAGTEVA